MPQIRRMLWWLLAQALRVSARLLANWAQLAAAQAAPPPVAAPPGPPAHWLAKVTTGPPDHWRDYIAARAPHLLAPGGMLASDTLAPVDGMPRADFRPPQVPRATRQPQLAAPDMRPRPTPPPPQPRPDHRAAPLRLHPIPAPPPAPPTPDIPRAADGNARQTQPQPPSVLRQARPAPQKDAPAALPPARSPSFPAPPAASMPHVTGEVARPRLDRPARVEPSSRLPSLEKWPDLPVTPAAEPPTNLRASAPLQYVPPAPTPLLLPPQAAQPESAAPRPTPASDPHGPWPALPPVPAADPAPPGAQEQALRRSARLDREQRGGLWNV